jgi:hypothetical protein
VKRIIFIPGFGEEASIFDKIQPAIAGEKLFIDNWVLLEELPEKGLTVITYAKFLIDRFDIKKDDVIVGHSMGGWVAYFIKQLVGSATIQISSCTDLRKVIKPVPSNQLTYWLAKRGFGFNNVVLHILVWLYYKNKPSKEMFITIFNRLKTGDKTTVAKQLMVIFNEVKQDKSVSPDLRIHAKKDHIIRPPDQPYHVVPGDHFALYTYPAAVAKPIADFLNR